MCGADPQRHLVAGELIRALHDRAAEWLRRDLRPAVDRPGHGAVGDREQRRALAVPLGRLASVALVQAPATVGHPVDGEYLRRDEAAVRGEEQVAMGRGTLA